ncbi:MAG: regulatory protein RecX [Candidatus Omnitrophota bacterium]|nr:regulatory protein RecX [Candidatus Omnitrophota bacterium]
MNSKNIDLLQKAKNYAFLLLKFRLRSENELRQRLEKKKFNTQIIERTLSFLKDKGFIDDKYFAKIWTESRVKRPLGTRRLKQELIIKGIDKAIIDSQINEIKKDYPEEEIVASIAKDRLNKLKGYDPQKARRRVYAYLLRRGFSPEVVIDALTHEE